MPLPADLDKTCCIHSAWEGRGCHVFRSASRLRWSDILGFRIVVTDRGGGRSVPTVNRASVRTPESRGNA